MGTIPGDACNGDASTCNEIYCQSSATTADINHTEYLTAGQTYFITLDGFAGDDCTFEFGVYSTNILPIELLSFKAKKEDNNVRLEWITSSEKNNDYFTIERSTGDNRYEVIATIVGAGTSNTNRTYLKEDRGLAPGIYYYRLKQTDYDGTSKFVGEIAVRINGEQDFVLSPNVTSTDTKLQMFLGNASYTYIQIYDVNGNLVFEDKKEFPKGTTSFAIPSSGFSQGTYFVKVFDGQQNTTLKLIKK